MEVGISWLSTPGPNLKKKKNGVGEMPGILGRDSPGAESFLKDRTTPPRVAWVISLHIQLPSFPLKRNLSSVPGGQSHRGQVGGKRIDVFQDLFRVC